MNAKTLRRFNYPVVSAIVLSMLLVPVIQAEGIVLDGVIESEYSLYIRDDTHAPIFSLYMAGDTDYVYLGIILEGDNDASNDQLEFAYRQQNIDFWIRVKDTICKYRPSGGPWQDWWQNVRVGLPESVEIVVGETNGETSYEIRIARSVLGKYGEDFPGNFQFWLQIKSDVNSVDYNWYPESTRAWWFYREDNLQPSFNGDENEPPQFHVPEIPYGTVLTLATMAAALAVTSKRPIIK